MSAAPFVQHAPLNSHVEAMEACRQPTDYERRHEYQHRRADIAEDAEFHHRVMAGIGLMRRLTEHWRKRDEAANEN